jgi:hypothetical protein
VNIWDWVSVSSIRNNDMIGRQTGPMAGKHHDVSRFDVSGEKLGIE